MTPFKQIHTAARSIWGETELDMRLPRPKSNRNLCAVPNSNYLSIMSRRVFRAGLKHSMVDAKWPVFEQVFHGFHINPVRMMSDEDLEKLMEDKRIIRHWGKVKSVRANAQSIYELLSEHKSFGHYLAAWPGTDVVGLWLDLRTRFSQLGGNSGPYFLRMSGKDTFVLTRDVVRGLNCWGAVQGEPKGKKALRRVQDCFNIWAEESGLPLSQMSMVLALSSI